MHKLSATPYVPLDDLTELMRRLSMQATHMTGTRSLFLNGGISFPAIPSAFTSVNDARAALEQLEEPVMRTLFSVLTEGVVETTDNPATHRTAHLDALAAWTHALDAHDSARSASLSHAERQASHLLRAQQITLALAVTVDHTGVQQDVCMWDGLAPQLEQLVAHAECALDMPAATGSDSNSNSNSDCGSSRSGSSSDGSGAADGARFFLDTGVLVPLYFAGSHSRDPVLRRRIIALCLASQRQEGMWNSLMVAKVLSRLMEIEERALDSDGRVPRWARITDVEVQLEPDSKSAVIRYLQQASRDAPFVQVFRESISSSRP
ncbi:hypothetical protein MBLNU459_g4220t2 [Dothideomycetes sp. NU459]